MFLKGQKVPHNKKVHFFWSSGDHLSLNDLSLLREEGGCCLLPVLVVDVGGDVGAALLVLDGLLQHGVKWLLLDGIEQGLVNSPAISCRSAPAPGRDRLEVGNPDGVVTDMD